MNRPVKAVFDFITVSEFRQVLSGLQSLGFRPAQVPNVPGTKTLFTYGTMLAVNKARKTYMVETGVDTDVFMTNDGQPCYGRNYITWHDE